MSPPQQLRLRQPLARWHSAQLSLPRNAALGFNSTGNNKEQFG
jgi:hypothetical protein